MSCALGRCLLSVLLLLAFALQQTGLTRAVDPCCDDESDSVHVVDCAETDEPGGCAPSCTDCGGCPGPGRVLLSTQAHDIGPACARAFAIPALVAADGRDPRLRLERPPRA